MNRPQTLAQFMERAQQAGYPYRACEPSASRYARTLPDTAWPSEQIRAMAWRLADYRVTGVSGGQIWLAPLTAGERFERACKYGAAEFGAY